MSWILILDDTFTRADTSPGAAGTTTGAGNSWVDRAGSVYSINTNRLRAASNASFRNWLQRPDAETSSYVGQKVILSIPAGFGEMVFSVTVRSQNPTGNKECYVASMSTARLSLRYNATTPSALTDLVGFYPLGNGEVLRDSTHDYELELSASGTGPTTVTAVLRDLTAGTSATLTASDSTATVQSGGAVWLSITTVGAAPEYATRVRTYYERKIVADQAQIARNATTTVRVTSTAIDFTAVTLTLSGGTGASITSQTHVVGLESSAIDVDIDAGTALGNLTITEPGTGETCTVEAADPYLTISPTQAVPPFSGLPIAVTRHLGPAWTPGTPGSPEFTVSGDGTPSASNNEITGVSTGTFDLDVADAVEGSVTITNPDNGAEATFGLMPVIPCTDANLRRGLSPGNWKVTDTYFATRAYGAYLEWRVNSTSMSLVVNVDALVTAGEPADEYPILTWHVDAGPDTEYQLQSTDTEIELATGLDPGEHDLFLSYRWCDGDNEAVEAWTPSSEAWPDVALVIEGLRVDFGGTAVDPEVSDEVAIIAGDSITAGRHLTSTESNPEKNFVAGMQAELGFRVCRIANGGTGWHTQTGMLPMFHDHSDTAKQCWRLLWVGESAIDDTDFNASVKWFFVFHGVNDANGSVSIDTVRLDATDWLAVARSVYPNAMLVLGVPFSQGMVTALTGALATYRAAHPEDARTMLLDLREEFSEGLTNDGPSWAANDGLHPYEFVHSRAAVKLVARVRRAGGTARRLV